MQAYQERTGTELFFEAFGGEGGGGYWTMGGSPGIPEEMAGFMWPEYPLEFQPLGGAGGGYTGTSATGSIPGVSANSDDYYLFRDPSTGIFLCPQSGRGGSGPEFERQRGGGVPEVPLDGGGNPLPIDPGKPMYGRGGDGGNCGYEHEGWSHAKGGGPGILGVRVYF